MKKIYYCIVACIGLFIACEEDQNTETGNNNISINLNLLIGSSDVTTDVTDSITWSASSFELEGVGVEDCRLDDQMTFRSNGTYRYNGGLTLCGGDDNTRIKDGTFSVDTASATITFDQGTDIEYTANIQSLSATEVMLSGSYLGMTIEGKYSRN